MAKETKQAVTREVAIADINSWLEFKRIRQSELEAKKDQIDALVDAVVDGVLIVNEDKSITHQLLFPIGEGKSIVDFQYKPRVSQGVIQNYLQGVKSSDADGRICAYIAALTSNAKAIITAMDTEDYAIAQSIALFFI